MQRSASLFTIVILSAAAVAAGAADPPKYSYDEFTPSEDCAMCHIDIARQHEQAMMSQSFIHHWDEIEYYELALPHAKKEARSRPIRSTRRPRTAVLTATLVNAKAGHMVPSGSVEERVLWLHVEARDSRGGVYHLPVDAKGFEGEEFTIASADAMAYQDIGDIKGIEGFPGLKRDGDVPPGDRIFRMPYFDPQGRMTVAQWNTASFGADYRLAPLEAVNETFTWQLPTDLADGEVEVTASVYYSKLVSSVAEYMGVPEEEAEPVLVSKHRTSFKVASP